MKKTGYLLLVIVFGIFFLIGTLFLFMGFNTRNPDGQRFGLMFGLPMVAGFGYLTNLFWRKMYKG